MRRIAFSIAAICACVAPTALSSAGPSYATPYASQVRAADSSAYAPLCEKDSPGYCWRDPSDGGPGTGVVNSGYGTDNARRWLVITDTGRCNSGFVTNTPPCPFTAGSGLNFTYNNDRIVVVRNLGSGYCAGSSLSDVSQFGVPIVVMHSCDHIGGVSELAAVFVEQKFSTHFRLVSVTWSDGGTTSFFINGDNINDDGLTVQPPGTYARWVGGGSGF